MSNNSERVFQIKESVLRGLISDSQVLNFLVGLGVDNWDSYSTGFFKGDYVDYTKYSKPEDIPADFFDDEGWHDEKQVSEKALLKYTIQD